MTASSGEMSPRCNTFSSRDSVMQMMIIASHPPIYEDTPGGSLKHKRTAFQRLFCFSDVRKLSSQDPQTGGSRAILERDKSSANHPVVNLGSTMTLERCAVNSNDTKSTGCHVGSQHGQKRFHDLASALMSSLRFRSVSIVIMRSRSQRVKRSVR